MSDTFIKWLCAHNPDSSLWNMFITLWHFPKWLHANSPELSPCNITFLQASFSLQHIMPDSFPRTITAATYLHSDFSSTFTFWIQHHQLLDSLQLWTLSQFLDSLQLWNSPPFLNSPQSLNSIKSLGSWFIKFTC